MSLIGPDACSRHGHRPSLGCGECIAAAKNWRDTKVAYWCCAVLCLVLAIQYALTRIWP